MKKLILIFAIVISAFALSGCNNEEITPDFAPSGTYEVTVDSQPNSEYKMFAEVQNNTITIFIEQDSQFDQKEDRKYHMSTIVFQQIEKDNWSMSITSPLGDQDEYSSGNEVHFDTKANQIYIDAFGSDGNKGGFILTKIA